MECIRNAPNGLRIVQTKHIFGHNQTKLTKCVVFTNEKISILDCIIIAPNGLRIVQTKHIFGDNQTMLTKYAVFPTKTMLGVFAHLKTVSPLAEKTTC